MQNNVWEFGFTQQYKNNNNKLGWTIDVDLGYKTLGHTQNKMILMQEHKTSKEKMQWGEETEKKKTQTPIYN